MRVEMRVATHALQRFARKSRQSIAPRNIARTALVAGTVSGLPSTLWAAASGRSVFEAARAAGTLVPGRRFRPGLVAGCAVHVAVSLFWTAGIAMARQARRGCQPPIPPVVVVVEGATAGLLIATLDLALISRRYPAIRSLPAIPQWGDHVAFGLVVTACLPSDGQRRRRYPAK